MSELALEGVALRTHDTSYPLDINPYAHQVEMRRLLLEDGYSVLVNDSPTGGGKTLSWLAPAIEGCRDTVAIFPTNALVLDQYGSIQRTADEAVDHDVAVVAITSDRLYELSGKYRSDSHGAVLDEWLTEKRRQTDQIILLTNPDIFVMLRRDLYRKPNRVYKQFELAVVDEFHRAGRKEQNTLRYLLDEMQEEDDEVVELRQVAFLSATPDERQEQKFERAMTASYHHVTEDGPDEQQSFTDPPREGWKPAMPPVELDVRAAPTFGTADVLIEDHPQETLSFCRGGRTVVMLDGVHEVKRVSTWLDDAMDARIERIDGFHGENKRAKLKRFDVLVSNSAVEVGIDFDVERILFAGHDRTSFLQRLGRLRSHPNWRTARCYVPRAIADTLARHDSQTLTRPELDDVVDSAYSEPRQPETFDARYSAAEAIEHLNTRLRGVPDEDHQIVKGASLERIKRHFSVGLDTDFSLRDMKAFTNALNWRVLTSLQWYRGDSIQALVYDYNRDVLTTYSIFYLLRYGDVEFYSLSEFKHEIPAKYEEDIARHQQYVDGFCVYGGTIETTDEGYGRDVYFTGGTLYDWLDGTTNTSRKPRVLSGLKIEVNRGGAPDRIRSVTKVNDRLRQRGDRTDDSNGGILCYPVYGPSNQVKRQYDLGEFFFLYSVKVQNLDLHSLALGTDALYLHCHVLEQAAQNSDQGGFGEQL